MKRALRLHPDSRREPVSRIDVEITRPGPETFCVLYTLTGRIGDVALPEPGPSEPQDGLWRHTCLELFVRLPEGYAEFNFAPSGAYAAYGFSDYRTGMTPLGIAPAIAVTAGQTQFQLEARLTLPGLPPGPLRIGLSAVIEEKNGAFSYWALDHEPGKPDFHHDTAFALEL